MEIFERLQLKRRAHKYKTKDDRGGIAFLLESIKEGQTAMDIGCHKAGYLYFMQQKVGDTGKVIAFEPQSPLFKYLSRMKKVFNWKNVTIEHRAVSDKVGKVKLYTPANKIDTASAPGATIVHHTDRPDMSVKEEIETETLDYYCERHHINPSFLKVDVEGNELQVFKGGIKTLEKYRPKILVEIEALHVGEEKARETFSFLESLGYNGRFINGGNRLPLSSFDFGKYQDKYDLGNYSNNFIFE